jgi:hypothetical protein
MQAPALIVIDLGGRIAVVLILAAPLVGGGAGMIGGDEFTNRLLKGEDIL